MRKDFLPSVKQAFPVLAGALIIFFSASPVMAQQHVIAQKDNTRPETARAYTRPATIMTLTAKKWNGYNEIEWSAGAEQDTRRYIVEYSRNGIDFQSAGEAVTDKGFYLIKHQILEDRPMLYRIKTEELSGRFTYSNAVVLEGIPVSPIRIFPTVLNTGQTMNINADWPVERIVITSSNGTQVFTKDINGQQDLLSLVVPSTFGKGMYFMTFFGQGWKTTSKFVVS